MKALASARLLHGRKKEINCIHLEKIYLCISLDMKYGKQIVLSRAASVSFPEAVCVVHCCFPRPTPRTASGLKGFQLDPRLTPLLKHKDNFSSDCIV